MSRVFRRNRCRLISQGWIVRLPGATAAVRLKRCGKRWGTTDESKQVTDTCYVACRWSLLRVRVITAVFCFCFAFWWADLSRQSILACAMRILYMKGEHGMISYRLEQDWSQEIAVFRCFSRSVWDVSLTEVTWNVSSRRAAAMLGASVSSGFG